MHIGVLASRVWWHDHLHREDWNIGVIHQTAEEIVQRGFMGSPRWFRKDEQVMLADPSCVRLRDGSLLVMAEQMDHRTGIGEIWSALVPATALTEDVPLRPWLTARTHLSYPFPFTGSDGEIYWTVETAEANNLFLWSRREDGSIASEKLILEHPAVDATVWQGADRWWLFCGLYGDAPNERLHLFYADCPDGPWTAHRSNPVKIDTSSCRPAGPLFMCNGMLIRPAQDCSRTYGGGLVLNVVEQLDPNGFRESAIRRLEPFPSEYPDGLHTFCPAGAVTLIDGKRWIYRRRELFDRAVRKLGSVLRRSRAIGNCRSLPNAMLHAGGYLSLAQTQRGCSPQAEAGDEMTIRPMSVADGERAAPADVGLSLS
jgi:hypothetical protein